MPRWINLPPTEIKEVLCIISKIPSIPMLLEALNGGTIVENHMDMKSSKSPETNTKKASPKDEEDPIDVNKLNLLRG